VVHGVVTVKEYNPNNYLQDLSEGWGQYGHLALASSSKAIYISKDFGDENIFKERTYFVNFKLDYKLKELLGFPGMFSNITVALHTFLSLLALVASDERTFNMFKQVKKYYRSTRDKIV
jgi:hypothetical protein